jgi:HD-GYP domain-containing protein (c-di-GMP phosphodiesterase class II)
VDEPKLSLAELVATMALATDMAMGHPMEQGLGAAIVATRMAELAGLPHDDLSRTYHLALLRHIGCTTERDGLAAMVGDEIGLGAKLDPLSGAKGSEYMGAFVRFVIAGKPALAKARAMAQLMVGMRSFNATNQAICEVAQMLASRLGFDRTFTDAIATVYERWDGKGFPNHVKGEAIPVATRISQVADLVAALHDLGVADVPGVVKSRSGSGFDPELANVFVSNARELLAELDAQSRWEVVQRLDPQPALRLDGEALDGGLRVVADFADLQSTFLVGHSSGVAELARSAAVRLHLPPADVDDVFRAGLVHDLGRIGVSASVWSKPGSLTAGEWEGVRLHPYHTDRVICRAPFLARLSASASMHHERLDGTGYFRGAAATQLPPVARVLAAADVFHAMTEPRPHRSALSPDEAGRQVQQEVRSGRLDREAVDAVMEAAGHRVARRKEFAGGLTAREVEVLRLLARGMSTKAIASKLVIAPKTVDNHIQSIYAKAGVTTRAAATVFAMQHGLLDTLSV